jgi:hypothetical protein
MDAQLPGLAAGNLDGDRACNDRIRMVERGLDE